MENNHYELPGGMQTFDIIKNALTDEEIVGAMKFNILKYKLRLGNKDSVDKELNKIRHYENILDNFELTGNWDLYPENSQPTQEELEILAGKDLIEGGIHSYIYEPCYMVSACGVPDIPKIDADIEEIKDVRK